MSASRTRLTAAAALLAAFVPATAALAQYGAYGARAVVEHNDLRWFEPVDLDLDGQMPRKDAGYFFSADKTWETVVNGKYQLGHPGLTVDSERIYRAPSTDVAFTVLDQVTGLGFIETLQEGIGYSGLSFVVADTQGTDSINDDVEVPFDTSSFGTVNALRDAVNAFNSDAGNIANNLTVRIGGEPRPYEVVNSVRDAFQDAGFAWGERYEFGYSDGEQGWMVTILDGPEMVSGGTYGAGEAAPFTSQSGTENADFDPFFGDTPQDLDGDGRLDNPADVDSGGDFYAFGFGSVAVNFNLPSPDFLSGYRDYLNNDIGAAGGTQAGPILYVGNYGGSDDEVNPVTTADSFNRIEIDDAITALSVFNVEATNPVTPDPDETILDQQVAVISDELNQALQVIASLDDDDQIAFLGVGGSFAAAQAALSALVLEQDAQENANAGMVPPNTLDAEIAALNTALILLNLDLAGIVIDVDGDGDGAADGGDGDTRLADDLNGNGQGGAITVLADINGDGAIDAGEIVAIINDFGDLHDFNVFFDEVTTRNRTKINGVELMRMHELSTRHKLQQGRWDSLRFSWGVRFLDIDDDFYFQGLGSILGRTTVATEVENQIIGPQIGLKWTRRDGPWNFVLEGRGMLGYNRTDVDQQSVFGEEAIPGALNRSAVARTTASVDGEVFDEFSPVGELRAMLKYRLAESVSLQAGYTAKYIGNVHRSYATTAWNAPSFGINDDTDEIFTNGLSFGVELRH